MLTPLISAFKYLAIMVPSMILGVVLLSLVINLHLLDRLSWMARPITRFGHLRDECGLSFIAAFGSPTVANSMLVDLYQKGKMRKKELYVASLANSFPAILMHWRSMFPILIPLLGVVGLAYFGILVLVGFLKTGLILLTGRLILTKRENHWAEKKKEERPAFHFAFRESIYQSKGMIKRIAAITIPVTVVIFILIDLGVFDAFSIYLEGISKYLPIPPEGITIIGAQFANSVAAYTVASNFLLKGVLTGYQIIIILLVGDVVTSIAGLRYLIPYYTGIFGPRLGMELMTISTIIRQSLIIVTIFVLLAIH